VFLTFTQSPESAEVLRDHQTGWFGEVGYKDLMQVANEPNGTSFKFEEMYKCEPSQKHFGFKSWDGKLSSPTNPTDTPPRC
jgi:phosphatidylserine decarboxylase